MRRWRRSMVASFVSLFVFTRRFRLLGIGCDALPVSGSDELVVDVVDNNFYQLFGWRRQMIAWMAEIAC
ncbi:hypothetical protein EVAR_57874_1 [Eumeta japonica]|uniref:Secreted protein n=1 Tax=Eumeta variegata TaxID=151549 RepID=A0A4C1ZEG1_EUMVA|nr:hypothetical protein EVAR_57874_1 [Eumeta japonica]